MYPAARITASLAFFVLAGLPLTAAEIPIPNDTQWADRINALAPGDVALLEAGVYPGGKTITAHGVTIRGAGRRATLIKAAATVLRFAGCRQTTLENVTITSEFPSGFAADFLDSANGSYQYPANPKEKRALREGIHIDGTIDCTFRAIHFDNVWTRGILAAGSTYNSGTVVEYCLFTRVGQDTASGDINFNDVHTYTIRHNIFAGNVDGVVFQGAGGGGLVEYNNFLHMPSENCVDFKEVYRKFNEPEETHMRYNVFYVERSDFSAVDLNITSRKLRLYYNIFRGMNPNGGSIYFRGRGTITDVEVVGNWFTGNGSGFALKTKHDGGKNYDNYVLHNIIEHFTNPFNAVEYLRDMYFSNNIIVSCGRNTGAMAIDLEGAARQNLLVKPEALWGASYLQGDPLYAHPPVSRLAEGSPGWNLAHRYTGRDFGPQVGIPAEIYGQAAPDFASLEVENLRHLLREWSLADLQAVYTMVKRNFPAGVELDCLLPGSTAGVQMCENDWYNVIQDFAHPFFAVQYLRDMVFSNNVILRCGNNSGAMASYLASQARQNLFPTTSAVWGTSYLQGDPFSPIRRREPARPTTDGP